MNNVTTFDNFPPFATNGSRNMNTESAKYAVGFLEGETFPAEWANYLFHGATKGISDLNTAVQSIWKENINVIQGSGQTPRSSNNTQLKTAIELMIQNAVLTANSQVLAQAKLDAHPVGSLYWSSNPTNPSTLFGGTWVQIKDRFIWAKGDFDTVNATGGSATVQLTESNLPAHSHTMNHNHTGSVSGDVGITNTNHTHNYSGTVESVIAKYGSAHTGGMSAHATGWFNKGNDGNNFGLDCDGSTFFNGNIQGRAEREGSDINQDYRYNFNIEHFHNFDHQHDFSGTTGESNGENSSVKHSHTWDGSVTIDSITANTGSVGSGTAHENMPPYIVKYCWERVS